MDSIIFFILSFIDDIISLQGFVFVLASFVVFSVVQLIYKIIRG